jgi:hypothetical protein
MKQIIPLILVASLFSCTEQSRLAKKGVVYNFPTGQGSAVVKKYEIQDKPKIQVEERSGHLVVQFIDTSYAPAHSTEVPINTATGFTASMAISNEYYFNEPQDKLADKSFVYNSKKLQLQAISVPFKFRSAIKNNPRVLDSLPSQVETSFSLGFAVGEKFTKNVFNSQKNLFGSYINKFSLYPGAFINVGTTTLKRLTTNDAAKFDQTVPLFSYGAFIMLGFNSINIGYNVGFDYALNSASKDWVYQGKLWQGITIGLDILK